VDDTRPDVISVLIIGPEDTPYANGCFLFDLFLDTDVRLGGGGQG
jgi:ubiquitin-protein ligase